MIFKSFISRAIFFSAIVLTGIFCSLKIWEKRRVIDWDITQYYSYLPATFMYGDYTFSDPDSLWQEAHFKYTVLNGDTLPVKMTAGLAYLYSPFFLGAHVYALNSGYEANAFSTPYKIGLLLSSLFFAIIGLWFLARFIALFFPEGIAVFTTLIIFAGTNLAYYTFAEPMSHVYSFALISLFLYSCMKYFHKPSTLRVLAVGISLGVLVLIRPVNIIVTLFPLILFLSGYVKPGSLKTTIGHLALIFLLGVIIALPQAFYWHAVTGNLFYYSYGKEGFFFLDPEIVKGLFSYRKGLFIYSPVLVLAIVGFIPFFKKNKKAALATLLCLASATWIMYSWWCWWYGGGFGARTFIDYFPFMALPLAAFFNWVYQKHLALKIAVWSVTVYCCFTSVFMSVQYFKGIIHHDSMTKELFWKQYLTNQYVRDYSLYLDPPNYEAALKNEDE